jgi:hypothetical protein
LNDEAKLRHVMQDSIAHNHPDVALKFFKMAVNEGRKRPARIVPKSAFTYHLAAKASTLVGKVDQASELMDQARHCEDYQGNENLQLDHIYELAEHFALERNFGRAQTLLMEAERIRPEDTESFHAYWLSTQRVRMLQGERDSFDELRKLRDSLILLARNRKLSRKQLLLDASWLLLLASVRFGFHRTFTEVIQDLRTSRLCVSHDHSLAYHLRDPDEQRQREARLMLRFGLLRRFLAHRLIWKPVF